METLKLSKPLDWCGQTYTALDLDFDGFNGADDRAIRAELLMRGQVCMEPRRSLSYLAILAGKAAKVPRDVLGALPVGDFQRAMEATRCYLRQGRVRDREMDLTKPLETKECGTLEHLILDLDGLRGQDILNVTDQLVAAGIVLVTQETSCEFLAGMGAVAAGLDRTDTDKLALCDHVALVNRVRNFFLRSTSR